MVGRLRASVTVAREAAWLAARGGAAGPGATLALLWKRAVDEDWSWSRLQGETVFSLFPGAGLVVVSGDDPVVHGAAAPLYDGHCAFGRRMMTRGDDDQLVGVRNRTRFAY